VTLAGAPRQLAGDVARDSASAPRSHGPAVPSAQAQRIPNATALLAAESKVRAAADEAELVHLVANELRKLAGARQVIVVRSSEPGNAWVRCVSSLATVDRGTPFVLWIEGMLRSILADPASAAGAMFQLPAFVDGEASETRTYPFRHFIWQPMRLASGEAFAGVLLARELPWSEQDAKVVAREAAAFGNAWLALYGGQKLRPARTSRRWWRLAGALAIGALCILPVPLTVLAPAEIVPRNPQRVTAPIDGIIKDILADPNSIVTVGQPILHFDDTTLRSRLQIAEQEVSLARAKYDRASQAAFGDDKARHELAIARAELAIKSAERDYSVELLRRSVLTAARDGVLLYADKAQLIGRPIKTGERLMQIATPDELAVRIELPVADAIILDRKARVRLFLDAKPLTPISAMLTSEAYHAEPNSTQQLVYRLHGDFADSPDGVRLGSRGTAQLSGSTVPLIYFLLRRPISTLRQTLGI